MRIIIASLPSCLASQVFIKAQYANFVLQKLRFPRNKKLPPEPTNTFRRQCCGRQEQQCCPPWKLIRSFDPLSHSPVYPSCGLIRFGFPPWLVVWSVPSAPSSAVIITKCGGLLLPVLLSPESSPYLLLGINVLLSSIFIPW